MKHLALLLALAGGLTSSALAQNGPGYSCLTIKVGILPWMPLGIYPPGFKGQIQVHCQVDDPEITALHVRVTTPDGEVLDQIAQVWKGRTLAWFGVPEITGEASIHALYREIEVRGRRK